MRTLIVKKKNVLQELDDMKKRLKEMEDEAAALREMQAKVEMQMGSTQGLLSFSFFFFSFFFFCFLQFIRFLIHRTPLFFFFNAISSVLRVFFFFCLYIFFGITLVFYSSI